MRAESLLMGPNSCRFHFGDQTVLFRDFVMWRGAQGRDLISFRYFGNIGGGFISLDEVGCNKV